MDAVNLQGIWLNFPTEGVSPTRVTAVAGIYSHYFISQAQIEQQRSFLRKFRQRVNLRALEYQQALVQQQEQQRTIAVYSVLFSEL